MATEREVRLRQYAMTYPTVLGIYHQHLFPEESPSLTGLGDVPGGSYEALQARHRRNCIYVPELDDHVDLEAWLERYRPSQIIGADHDVRRLVVMGPANVHEFLPFDQPKVKAEWEALLSSGRHLTPGALQELAEKVHYISGKWICYPDTGLKVDHYWNLIATATVRGVFGTNCTGAKVRPYEPERRHAMCIHNKHYNNFQEVKEIENKIRAIGLKCVLQYKPDIYTELSIHASNAYDFNFSSHLYRSVFDIKKGCSTIKIL